MSFTQIKFSNYTNFGKIKIVNQTTAGRPASQGDQHLEEKWR